MKKSLLRISFIFIALVLSSKAFVALFGYQAIESARDAYGQDVSISYGWISSNFDGSLILQDVILTPYHLKRQFRVSELRFQYSSYFSLMLGLLDLKSLSLNGLNEVHFSSVTAPLEGRDLEQWLAGEYGQEILAPLGVYGCGEIVRVGHQELKEMGILEQKADVSIYFDRERGSAGPHVELRAELYELGRLELGLSLGPLSSHDGTWTQAELRNLSVSYVDNGYLRRVANMCESKTGLLRNEFAKVSALEWKKHLRINGIIVSDELVNAYYTYMSLGGKVEVSLLSQKPSSLAEISTQFDTDLFDENGVSIILNEVPVMSSKVVLEASYFRPTKVEEKVVAPVQKKIEKAFIPLEMDALDEALGKQLRVVLSSGKRYEGTLRASDEFYFELAPPIGGGNVIYNVKREEVAELFVLSGEP